MTTACPECDAEFPDRREMVKHLIAAPLGHGEGRQAAPRRCICGMHNNCPEGEHSECECLCVNPAEEETGAERIWVTAGQTKDPDECLLSHVNTDGHAGVEYVRGDLPQLEVDRLWEKITELNATQSAHEHEMRLITDESDRLHKENQALRRELEGKVDDGLRDTARLLEILDCAHCHTCEKHQASESYCGGLR